MYLLDQPHSVRGTTASNQVGHGSKWKHRRWRWPESRQSHSQGQKVFFKILAEV